MTKENYEKPHYGLANFQPKYLPITTKHTCVMNLNSITNF